MRKLIITALAAAVATLSFTADADARNRGYQWHNNGHHGWHHNGHRNWHGHYHGHGHNHGWYGGYWGFGFPGIVIAPGYYGGGYSDCYIRKVRRHDANGHVYIRRVRVCN